MIALKIVDFDGVYASTVVFVTLFIAVLYDVSVIALAPEYGVIPV